MSASPVYALRSLKTMNGRQGLAFSATLLRDGQPVAEVGDEAAGGLMRFDWLDWNAPRVAAETENGAGQTETIRATPEEARLWAYVRTLPPVKEPSMDRTFPMDPEWLVNDLVDTAASLKAMRAHLTRAMKTKVVAVRDDDRLVDIKVEPTDMALAHIREKYPQFTVLNGLPIEQAAVQALNAERRKSGRTPLPMSTEAELAPKGRARRRTP